MARRRPRTAQQTPAAHENDPTPQRLRRDDFATIPAPRFVDEHIGRDRLVTTRRRVSPLVRMEAGADPWLDQRGAGALERYELLIEQAGYDAGSRGCLVGEPSGGEYASIIDLRYAARVRLARAANAIAVVDLGALLLLNAILSPMNDETVGALAKRMMKGGLPEAKSRIRIAAAAAADHFHRL